MDNKDQVRLHHMLDYSKEAVDLARSRTFAELKQNRMFYLSLVRIIEIVGEAANKISLEFQNRYPSIPWRDLIKMRNRIVHEYHDIKLYFIWKTVKEELPNLIKELEKILSNLKSS